MADHSQKVETDTYTEVSIQSADGTRVFSVTLTDGGPRSCGGKLLAELGNGERREIWDVLRFLDEVWTHGKFCGMREEQQAK